MSFSNLCTRGLCDPSTDRYTVSGGKVSSRVNCGHCPTPTQTVYDCIDVLPCFGSGSLGTIKK